MSLTCDQLLEIKDLPSFLRTEHCYNDLQHAMLVILFRHGLCALNSGKLKYADKIIDNASLYLYIHFLNEEEGMAYEMSNGLISRDELSEHSELHINFLDHWKHNVLIPYKKQDVSTEETVEELSNFYNLIIDHINHTDIPTYGPCAITAEQTRHELARIAQANMPMSPFMAGAFDTVNILAPDVANSLDAQRLSPRAMEPIGPLDLVPNIGQILSGQHGSLRDRFAQTTGGDQSAIGTSPQIYIH